MLYNRPVNSALPQQQTSYKKKFLDDKDKNGTTKWQKDTMDALEAVGRYAFYNNIELRKDYEIMQGRFNVEDYIDNFDAYDFSTMIYQEMKLPSFLKHYDITTKAVKLLLGEFIKRPDLIEVIANDPETSNEKLRLKTELTMAYMKDSINQEITQKLLAQGIDPNKSNFQSEEEANQYKQMIQEKYQEFTPQSIERYLTYDFRTAGEHWGNATLRDDIERFRIKEQDIAEFYHMCVSDRAISHVFLTPSGYGIETWNPLTVFYQYSAQNKNIEDLAYAGRILYMSKTEIIDTFGWRMTEDQLTALYPEYQKGETQGSVYKEAFNATLYPFADYREYDTLTTAVGQAVAETNISGSPYGIPQFGFYPGTDGTNYIFTQADIVQITQAYWKSQRKVGKLNILDQETGKPKVVLVDEFFDPKLFGVAEVKESFKDSDEPNTISWTWATETWQGIKINVNYQKNQTTDDRHSIYIDIRPCEFQFRGNDPRMLFYSKLPVIGNIFNNINGRSQSVVDLLKPYQIFVNALFNQAYFISQKNNGKFAIMGASLLQSNKDWGGEEAQEKFMTIAQNLGLVVVDDSTSANQASMQYGLKVLDLDESERISRTINLAMLVENQGLLQLGITPQRMGTTQASETATGVETAVNNSYAITEIYFEQFSNYRRRKLQHLLELAQYVESQGEGDVVKQYTTSDLGKAFVQIAKTDLLLKNLGVYVMNSSEMKRKKELIEQLLLKNNQTLMPFSKLIEMVRLDSLADIQKKIEEQERIQQKAAQEQEQQKIKMEQDALAAEMQEKDKQRAFEAEQNQLDRQNKLKIEELKGIANEGSFSPEVDTTDKLIEQTKLGLQASSEAFNQSLQRQNLLHTQVEASRKNSLEKERNDIMKKQFKAQENIAKEKTKQERIKNEGIQIQNKNQEKMQDKQMEMLDAKAKLEEKMHKMKLEEEEVSLKAHKVKIKLKPKK